MSDQVRNPEDRFSHNEVHFSLKVMCISTGGIFGGGGAGGGAGAGGGGGGGGGFVDPTTGQTLQVVSSGVADTVRTARTGGTGFGTVRLKYCTHLRLSS